MAGPSRPCEISPALVRRDVPSTAATTVAVGGKDEKIRDMNPRRGATRLQQSNANVNGTWVQPSPKSSLQPTNLSSEIKESSPSRSEEQPPVAISTPDDAEETTSQPLPALSLSMDSSSTILPELVPSTVRPTLTVQVDFSTMNATSTIRPASTVVPAFLVDTGAKINEQALPGMNQGDPSLVTVPGMNQEDPLLLTTPAIMPLATPESSLLASPTSAMTVEKPMPGKNQPKPTTGAAAASSTTPSDSSPTVVASSSTPMSTTSTTTSTAAESSASPFSAPATLVVFTSSSTESSTTTSSSVMSPVLTFVTITRTAQGKEGAQSSTQSVPIPQAVTAPQSLPPSVLASSLIVGSSIPSSLATAVSVEPQSGLTPLARSLFILFGVLGFVTILIALGIIWVMRSNKRRAQTARQQQAARDTYQETGEYDGYGNTIRISTNNSIKTFLTASEKAIVDRAATPDGDTDASAKPSNALTDAINSFITKSRRMTYKISP